MSGQVQNRSYSFSSVMLLVALMGGGFAANFFAPQLFTGFSYLFGSVFVLMALRLFGTGWGLAAGVIAASATILQFGHPYAMTWLCAEPLFVGWLLAKGKTRNVIFFDAVYWPVLGAPLLWVIFRYVMHVDAPLSMAALLLYWITGITNALLASILLTHVPGLTNIVLPDVPRSIPIHHLIFNILMVAVLIPAIVILVVYGRGAEQRVLHDVSCDLEDCVRNAVYEVRLKQLHQVSVPDQVAGGSVDEGFSQKSVSASVSPEVFKKILLELRTRAISQLTLVDGRDRVIASTENSHVAGDLFQACPDGIQSQVSDKGLSCCTPQAVSSLPLWERNQRTRYSVAMNVAHSTSWRVVGETSFEPYQLLLIDEYRKALLAVLCMNMLALAISLYTSRRLAAPLLELSRVTTDLPERILDGKHTFLPKSMVAEIDRLSDNFRAMAVALGSKFQEISLYSETLEARVRERTKELTRANEELSRENTERTLTEQQRDQLMDELVNQLRLLQKIIDAIPNPIFYRDINGVYQGCNHAFEVSWGLSREEIVGKTTRELFPEQIAEKFQRLNGDNLNQTGVQIYESQLRYADGLTHEVIIYKATYDDIKGALAGVVGNIVDISLRKKAETERDRLVVELQQKNKELEGIVYVASHDLRSPLVNIQGFSRKLAKNCAELETLVAECALAGEQRQRLERILRDSIPKSLGFIVGSVEKMDVILKGLLRLSRLGRAALCFETLDMKMMMEKIVSSMAYQIDAAGARIEIGNLGACLADAGQINQVFSNLLDNAVKYRSPARPLVVTVFSEEFDEGIRYCVEDNGIGIPREQQDAIWEIFQRLSPDDSQGEGLGLTMARRIMSRLGGSIWVESEENVGSRFYVVVPKQAVIQ
ncbi:MAG: PAS domain S-box protein [Desulfuromonadales bacterium]|nr:PAS domain S-box protein [Desulfuromonadales bacterium]